MPDDERPHFLFPLAEGTEITPELGREIDDTFFSRSPLGVLRARLDRLLAAYTEHPDLEYGPFREILGVDPAMLAETVPSQDERDTEVALEAFQLRHQTAELLVRLVAAVLRHREQGTPSVWATLAKGEIGIHLEVKYLVAHFPLDPEDLILPASDADRSNPALVKAVLNSGDWIARAGNLLTNSDFDQNVVHNKLKHGFAAGIEDRLRVDFVTQPPDPDGNMTLEALQEAAAIVDSRLLAVLAEVPKRIGQAERSLEVLAVNLRPETMLTEAAMMMTVYGQVFATAAALHHGGNMPRELRHPGLPLGPTPPAAQRGKVVGFREALTHSPVDGTARELAVAFPQGVMTFAVNGPVQHGVVTEGAGVAPEPEGTTPEPQP